jgi:hypothetical protein
VALIAPCDDFIEMLVLAFYDLVRSFPMVRKVTWPAQLPTRHRFHRFRSGLGNADEIARRVADGAVAHPPGLGCRLLKNFGARLPDSLEGAVEVVGTKDRGLQRSLRHE